jgi:capsular exopolysaccharide synthesis family protein
MARLRGNEIKNSDNFQNYEDGIHPDQLLDILRLERVLWVIRRRFLLITGIGITILAAFLVKAFLSSNLYQSKFEILTEPRTAENELIYSIPETLGSGIAARRESEISINDATLQVLKSPKLLASIVKQINEKYPQQITYGSLVANLTITPVITKPSPFEKTANILEISYQNENPSLVKEVTQLLAQSYIDYSLKKTLSNINEGIKFVEGQIPQLREQVNTRQKKLANLQFKYNIVDPDLALGNLSGQIVELENKAIENQIEFDKKGSSYYQTQQELGERPPISVSIPGIADNEIYKEIRLKIAQIDAQIARQSVIYTNNSIEMKNLKEERSKLLYLVNQIIYQIQGENAKEVQSLEIRQKSIAFSVNELRQKREDLLSIYQEYKNLNRELEIFTTNLDQFLSKKAALQIEASQTTPPWQLLSSVSSPQPLPKNLAAFKKELVLGTVLGLFVGVVFALIVDIILDRFYNIDEVEEFFELPILGTIPHSKELQKSRNTLDKSIFKAFYSLYSNIQNLNLDTPLRSLVVTSALSKDGKSTIVKYLSEVISQTNRLVLVVETDLHSLSLKTQENKQETSGLTDILEKDLDFNIVIERSPVNENLWHLKPGSQVSNPTKLFSSQKMENLMRQLEVGFDLVIYDTASLLQFSDAYPLINHSQGVLFVISLNKIKRSQMEKAIAELQSLTTPILGIVQIN